MNRCTDFASLAGKDQFVIMAKRNGKTVFASLSGVLASWHENPAFACVYDAQDDREFKVNFWGSLAKMHGIDKATVRAQEISPCAS